MQSRTFSSVGLLLIFSGSAGFLFGSVQNGTWQLAVESAQVLAGLIQYPQGNPFYLHHTKLWSLLHQISAFLLLIGISERTLSFLFSGILSMLYFQALSLTVWAICKSFLVGLATPILIVAMHATKYCAIYPVVLLGTSNTHGAIGLALVLMILALIGSDRLKEGAFLLGLIPSIHLSLGILCWLVVLIGLLFLSGVKESFQQKRNWFIAGFFLTILSLSVHLLLAFDQPYLSMKEGARYVHAFVKNWDSHRIPISIANPGVVINSGVLVLILIWAFVYKKERDNSSYFLLLSFMVASVLGLIFVLLSHIPPEKLPVFLIIMMPARILELNVLAFVALLAGLAGRFIQFQQSKSLAFVFKGVLIIVLGVLTIRIAFYPDRFRQEPEEWNNFSLKEDTVLKEASKQKTILLTGSDLHLIQLRTRRPVLLDGGQLDTLPYTYESGPEMAQILREVYGVDFFHAPPEGQRTARIRVYAHRKLWEARSLTDWKMLSKKYQFTQVLTYQDWKLVLPQVLHNDNFVLYQIPPL